MSPRPSPNEQIGGKRCRGKPQGCADRGCTEQHSQLLTTVLKPVVLWFGLDCFKHNNSQFQGGLLPFS